MTFARISGTGSYLPVSVVTNRDLEQKVDTSDEWITARTGIRQRHVAAPDELTSDLALKASQMALQAANLSAQELDLILVATTTPDQVFPSTACILQDKLGAFGFPALDVQAVCSGFVYAMAIAEKFIASGSSKHVLVVGAEALTRLVDWSDRGTCVLFGDGAGAVVLSASDEPGIISTRLHADGRYRDLLKVPGNVADGVLRGSPYVQMDGQAVFKFAVKALGDAAEEVLRDAGVSLDQLDWLVPHQANIRIIEATAKRLHLPMERVVVTLANQGNTSAASIPLAFDIAVRDGRIQRGHQVLMEGIGGGFAWGSVLLKY